MPSLILTGHPCIGKTTFAQLLASRALNHPSNTISHVIHIRESTACPDQTKAECYSNSNMEKNTRSSLKAEFDRAVMSCNSNGNGSTTSTSSTLVILDSLNYIKGYRYELYCISKAAGERHGVVWIMGSESDSVRSGVCSTSDELSKKRNANRKEVQQKKQQIVDHATRVLEEISNIENDGYYDNDKMMNELVLRYEPPDMKNRWENPLYKVNVGSVLPWGKDGTVQSNNKDDEMTNKKVDESSDDLLVTIQMKDMNVKDETSQSSSDTTPSKPTEKKSASGFKRRTKKSSAMMQQQTTSSKSELKVTRQFEAPAAPSSIPSSMASRNLKPDASEQSNGDGVVDKEKKKIEDVIDTILDSFLTDTAPLQEGMSTLNQISAESNVLNQVDNLTQRVNHDILKAQQKTASLSSAGVGGGRICIENGKRGQRYISLSKPLYMNELRTVRRQFLKWIAGHPMVDGTAEEDMVENYIAYIESNI